MTDFKVGDVVTIVVLAHRWQGAVVSATRWAVHVQWYNGLVGFFTHASAARLRPVVLTREGLQF